MLYQFFRDMLDILRLRYRHPDSYRYTLPVILAVLLLLGAINAASMSPLFGNSIPAVVFSILLTMVKWLVLSVSMSKVLNYYGAPKMQLYGFTLVSEALATPMLLVLYAPQLMTFAMFYQIWTFWVQAIGFMRMGRVNGLKIMLGYLLYAFGTLAVGTILLMLFIGSGWLDSESLQRQLELITANPKS